MSHPEKSTVLIFVICAVAVGGAAFYAYNGSNFNQIDEPKQIIVSNINVPTTTAGTKEDWRSQFAFATTSQYAQKTPAKTPATPNTITEALGIDFMAHFADLRQANLVNNTDIVDQTMGSVLATDLSPLKPKAYTVNNLKKTPGSDAVSLQTFSDSLANLINSYSSDTSEQSVLQEYTTSNDSSVLSAIQPIIKEQKRILAGLLAIPVPQSLSNNYLNLVNGMGTLEAASESLLIADTDAVRGLVGSSLHADGAEGVANALSAIYQTLGTNGVSFNLHWEILNPLLN